MLPTIFVAIASYRDPECQFTIRDLFAKAAHPERINIGVCWQYEPEKDGDCFILESPYPAQTRSLRFLPWESKGGCWARAKALSLAEGEDYILQIDAHMRFEPGWDDTLIETLARCASYRGNGKVALTTSPPPYTPAHNLEDMAGHLSITVILKVHAMEGLQPISIGGTKRPLGMLKKSGPVPTPFITANFLFARREMFEEVPYDPYIYFRGQESTYSLRLFTHGYNCYHPDSTVAYHYWDSQTRRDPKDKGSAYKDFNDESPAALLARQRVWHLLGLKVADNPAALAQLEHYGVGSTRTPAAFWDYSGVDLPAGHMTMAARQALWPVPPDSR